MNPPNLSAAAPDLYKVVADWLEYMEGNGVDSAEYEAALWDAMRAAVAKADQPSTVISRLERA